MNAETDQHWDRPPLVDFQPRRDKLVFQQIDAEEGMYRHKAAIRLFGVTEVSTLLYRAQFVAHIYSRLVTLFYSMSPTSSITSTLLPQ